VPSILYLDVQFVGLLAIPGWDGKGGGVIGVKARAILTLYVNTIPYWFYAHGM
jgi:hypothetical protein